MNIFKETIAVIILLCVVTGIYLLTGGQGIFVRKKVAIEALKTKGFTDIRVVKKQWHFLEERGAAKDDDVKFTAETMDSTGKKVTVYVYVKWPSGTVNIKIPKKK